MKHCINPKENVSQLPKEVKEAFLARPLKFSKIQELAEKGLQKLYCSKSCMERMAKKCKAFLQEKGVSIEVQNLKGKPLSLSLEQIMEFNELRKEGLSYRKIAEKIGASKSSLHYLQHYAQRTKLKSNGKVLSPA